jgi:hypothetical protein
VDLLIPAEFPESAHGLHHFVFGHVGPEREDCDSAGLHFNVGSPGSGFVEDDKGLVFRNAGVSVNGGVRRDVIDFPTSDFIAVQDSSEVEFFEQMVTTDPRDNLIL